MDYEKAYKDALERAKRLHTEDCSAESKDTCEYIFPELAESEDERIRVEIKDFLEWSMERGTMTNAHRKRYGDWITWLEKQKESTEELVYRMNGLMQEYVRETKNEELHEHRFKCYKLFWDALEDTSYFEKQKEQKSNKDTGFPSVTKFVYNKSDEEFIRYCANILKGNDYGVCAERLLSMIEQKPVEKQDYSGLTDFERAIHRGFLCAGVENVPVSIIKETAKDCLANLSAEWSEEDERIRQGLIKMYKNEHLVSVPIGVHAKDIIRFLENLRPSWKPSKKQMAFLKKYINDLREDYYNNLADKFQKLYDQLKAL